MIEPRVEQRIEEMNPVPLLDLSWSSSSNVLNLSRLFVPSSAQLSLLEKGLTFSPKPRSFSRELLRRDLHYYHRLLKLRDYFDNDDFCREPFIQPSVWEPEWGTLSESLRSNKEGYPVISFISAAGGWGGRSLEGGTAGSEGTEGE